MCIETYEIDSLILSNPRCEASFLIRVLLAENMNIIKRILVIYANLLHVNFPLSNIHCPLSIISSCSRSDCTPEADDLRYEQIPQLTQPHTLSAQL